MKSILKRFELINKINAFLKASIYSFQTKRLDLFYQKRARFLGISYSQEEAIRLFKNKVESRVKVQEWFQKKCKPNVFWIGTNWDQDNSGILNGLRVCSNLRLFYRPNGNYGFLSDISLFGHEKTLEINNSEITEAIFSEFQKEKIDIIVGQMWANYVSQDILMKFKEMGIIVINISMDDRLPEMWKSNKKTGSLGLKDGLDIVLTTAKETCQWYWVEGVPAIYWPLASCPKVFRPSNHRDIDISFIGNKYGYRGEIIGALKANGVAIEAFGKGWENGYVNAEQAANILSRSKMSLGIGTIGHTRSMLTLKLRDFDVPMSGALYITHRNKELHDLFVENKEVLFYSDINELVKKVKYYLDHEDEMMAIAENGRRRVLKDHSWEHRFESLFNNIFSNW
jgi:spore maturation protein CgeB